MKQVYLSADEIDFKTLSLADRPEPKRILMTSPDQYNLTEAINEFMTDATSKLNKINHEHAFKQWSDIRWHCEALGNTVLVIRAQNKLEDMIFAADTGFPFVDRKTGKHSVIMSNMRKDKRKPEVPYFQAWYRVKGYEAFHLSHCSFESAGDALWYPGKYLIIAGYGSSEHHRTDLAALYQVAEIIDCPVVGIELEHDDFYHLDTTLSVIDKDICIVYKRGVSKEGFKILKKLFKHVIEVSKAEAYPPHFACNVFALNKTTVLIQKTAKKTIKVLESNGKKVIPVDTSEFIKSGGSVHSLMVQVY